MPAGLSDAHVAERVNLQHMQLIIHAATDPHIFELGDKVRELYLDVSFLLKQAKDAPYLLLEILAFSARHLAHLGKASLHQAIDLQTQAVSLFNSSWNRDITEDNCAAVLLFSTLLAHHNLADAFSRREDRTLSCFVNNFTQCVDVHRGIHHTAVAAYPLLKSSELGPTLSWSSSIQDRKPKGYTCQSVLHLVERSHTLDEAGKEACRHALSHLQVGFDMLSDTETLPGNHLHMVFIWPLRITPAFTALLKAQSPEAINVLALYATLLLYAKGKWQIGDAGSYILGLIKAELDPEWHCWTA